jgi:hypothetical protein
VTSPYANKDRSIWTEELEGHFDDLHEGGVNLAIPREVSVEIAGTPDNRQKLAEHFAAKGWSAMPGVGEEPLATVLLLKKASWTEEAMLTAQCQMLDAAERFGCVFEGLCYHVEVEG